MVGQLCHLIGFIGLDENLGQTRGFLEVAGPVKFGQHLFIHPLRPKPSLACVESRCLSALKESEMPKWHSRIRSQRGLGCYELLHFICMTGSLRHPWYCGGTLSGTNVLKLDLQGVPWLVGPAESRTHEGFVVFSTLR